ncbi:pyridoxal phosphate-dependent aminotransferase [Streptomyces sp. NPDC020490]|uniref:pyridoxal phosphate-dependent aminotransferase n=1 Tax=Streptomyces sp. NPDC020490 TaxID=3365078 RepID=UPI0037A3CFE4
MNARRPPYTLTEHEWPALARDALNMADAHARHSLSGGSVRRVSEVVHGLLVNGRSDYFEAEATFREALAQHTGQHYRAGCSHLTYSASIALDVVAKHLLPQQGPIGVITPTFDSVPALFGRSGLELSPIPERRVLPVCDLDFLSSLRLSALIIVAPNNPTGAVLPPDQALELLEWAARNGTTLVLDTSFRMFDPGMRLDLIEAADGIGADTVTVDDTGKTIPLHDTKVGILSASRALAPRIGMICSDVLLNVSELNLRMLAALLEDGGPDGEVARARDVAAANLARLEQRYGLEGPTPGPGDFQPSVSWLHWGPRRDAVIEACRSRAIELLPGDRFYWDRVVDDGDNPGSEWIRLPLLRDEELFSRGLELLDTAARSVGAQEEAV